VVVNTGLCPNKSCGFIRDEAAWPFHEICIFPLGCIHRPSGWFRSHITGEAGKVLWFWATKRHSFPRLKDEQRFFPHCMIDSIRAPRNTTAWGSNTLDCPSSSPLAPAAHACVRGGVTYLLCNTPADIPLYYFWAMKRPREEEKEHPQITTIEPTECTHTRCLHAYREARNILLTRRNHLERLGRKRGLRGQLLVTLADAFGLPTEIMVLIRQYAWTKHCLDGSVKYVPFRGEHKHGVYKRWNTYGDLVKRVEYSYGMHHGLTEVWESDGTKREESRWFAGRNHGVSTWWSKNGNIDTEKTHRYGWLCGIHREWAPFWPGVSVNNMVTREVRFEDNMEVWERRYFSNNQVSYEGRLCHDPDKNRYFRFGTWKAWCSNGLPDREEEYCEEKTVPIVIWRAIPDLEGAWELEYHWLAPDPLHPEPMVRLDRTTFDTMVSK